jgi:DNA ligase D-like protein (predicted ligase)
VAPGPDNGPEFEIPLSQPTAVERLPDFVEPMLARLETQPFDSDEHLFEIKWDGIRALCFVENGAHRLVSRRQNDMTERYPELGFLADLSAGTLLDGELVVLQDGRPDFHSALRREQGRGTRTIANLAASLPASYVVFDVLYSGFEPLMTRPLFARREVLRALVEAADNPRLVRSEGIVGGGRAVFEEMRGLGLEGMLAKRLDSPYLPGARTDAWIKIKTSQELACVIVGYTLDDGGGLKSLILASDARGELACVGKVGSGLSETDRADLLARLGARPRSSPLVPTAEAGQWVEPELFCTVGFQEWTPDGNLRAPVWRGLVEGG